MPRGLITGEGPRAVVRTIEMTSEQVRNPFIRHRDIGEMDWVGEVSVPPPPPDRRPRPVVLSQAVHRSSRW